MVPVFLLIGMVTALWRSSGTISFFLYHGLRGIAPGSFLLMAFLIPAALSFALGTSYGVTGTAGVVLITLARSGGVDLASAAGAILSGAYFGDRCSPMSSCATLVAACTGTRLYDNVREMLRTGLVPTVLTAAVFGAASLRHPIASVDDGVLSALAEGFSLHWSVLLPAALMLVLPLARVPVKWAMAASAAAALVLTVFLQGLPWAEALRTALLGYQPSRTELGEILSGGGMLSMVKTCAIVLVTSLYAGILEGIDALAPAKGLVERLAGPAGALSRCRGRQHRIGGGVLQPGRGGDAGCPAPGRELPQPGSFPYGAGHGYRQLRGDDRGAGALEHRHHRAPLHAGRGAGGHPLVCAAVSHAPLLPGDQAFFPGRSEPAFQIERT